VDFAFWCTYKYLNGGPGSTAALYVNQRHFDKAPGLAGWWGNDKETQFELKQQFEPAAGAGAWQIGTPPILSTIALKGALEITLAAGIERLRAKSLALTEYLMYLIDNKLEPLGFSVGTPREDHRRGGHVALVHPELAVRVNQALKARRIVPDFRPPDIIRLAPIPLYNSFHEVWQVVDTIHRVVETEEYLKFEDRPDTVS
jgi:kynureninase